MSKLREIFCRHEWRYLEEPNDDRDHAKLICTRCNKVANRHKGRFKVQRGSLFCWCPKCRYDLCRDSYMQQDGDLVTYECSNCGTESVWNFVASMVPFAVKVEEVN